MSQDGDLLNVYTCIHKMHIHVHNIDVHLYVNAHMHMYIIYIYATPPSKAHGIPCLRIMIGLWGYHIYVCTSILMHTCAFVSNAYIIIHMLTHIHTHTNSRVCTVPRTKTHTHLLTSIYCQVSLAMYLVQNAKYCK